MTEEKNEALQLLKDSLSETQISVRAYDTKAQIVGIGYIFTLNVIGQISAQLPAQAAANTVTIVVAWTIVIMPIVLFGYVLYPVRKSVVDMDGNKESEHMLFFHPESYNSPAALVDAASNCDPQYEIAYELLKMSELRESKRKRFISGLVGAGLAFIVLFSSQIYESLTPILG